MPENPDPSNVPLPLDTGTSFYNLYMGFQANCNTEYIPNLCAMYPEISTLLDEAPRRPKLKAVSSDVYKGLKERILTLDFLLSAETGLDTDQRTELVKSTLEKGYRQSSQAQNGPWFVKVSMKAVSFLFGSSESPRTTVEVPKDVTNIDDATFMAQIPVIADRSPALVHALANVTDLAQKHFRDNIKRESKDFARKICNIQRNACREQITQKVRINESNKLEALHASILHTLRSSLGEASAK